ncbi:hypothetical protein QJQ45_024713 [Haematococcus lacustris]|nr:hypothetical protein QJQ45_024713 [Haematococcus lacustris]
MQAARLSGGRKSGSIITSGSDTAASSGPPVTASDIADLGTWELIDRSHTVLRTSAISLPMPPRRSGRVSVASRGEPTLAIGSPARFAPMAPAQPALPALPLVQPIANLNVATDASVQAADANEVVVVNDDDDDEDETLLVGLLNHPENAALQQRGGLAPATQDATISAISAQRQEVPHHGNKCNTRAATTLRLAMLHPTSPTLRLVKLHPMAVTLWLAMLHPMAATPQLVKLHPMAITLWLAMLHPMAATPRLVTLHHTAATPRLVTLLPMLATLRPAMLNPMAATPQPATLPMAATPWLVMLHPMAAIPQPAMLHPMAATPRPAMLQASRPATFKAATLPPTAAILWLCLMATIPQAATLSPVVTSKPGQQCSDRDSQASAAVPATDRGTDSVLLTCSEPTDASVQAADANEVVVVNDDDDDEDETLLVGLLNHPENAALQQRGGLAPATQDATISAISAQRQEVPHHGNKCNTRAVSALLSPLPHLATHMCHGVTRHPHTNTFPHVLHCELVKSGKAPTLIQQLGGWKCLNSITSYVEHTLDDSADAAAGLHRAMGTSASSIPAQPSVNHSISTVPPATAARLPPWRRAAMSTALPPRAPMVSPPQDTPVADVVLPSRPVIAAVQAAASPMTATPAPLATPACWGTPVPSPAGPPLSNHPAAGHAAPYITHPTAGQAAPYGSNPVAGHAAPYGSHPAAGQAAPYGNNPVAGHAAPYGSHPAAGHAAPYCSHPAAGNAAPYASHPAAGYAEPYGSHPTAGHASYGSHPVAGHAAPYGSHPAAGHAAPYGCHPAAGHAPSFQASHIQGSHAPSYCSHPVAMSYGNHPAGCNALPCGGHHVASYSPSYFSHPYGSHPAVSTPVGGFSNGIYPPSRHVQYSPALVMRPVSMRPLYPSPAPWPCVPQGVCPDAMARLSANEQLYVVCQQEGMLPFM